MPDKIGEAYQRATEWAEELWNHAKLYPIAQRHCPDRVKVNQELLDRFDALWTEAKRDDKAHNLAISALIEWWVDLGIMLEDCQGINRVDSKASRMTQDQPEQANRQMVLEFV